MNAYSSRNWFSILLLLSSFDIAAAIQTEIPNALQAQVASSDSLPATHLALSAAAAEDGKASMDVAAENRSKSPERVPLEDAYVMGQVVDQSTNMPLASVAILFEDTAIGTITDAEGRYKLGPAPAGSYTLTFVKTGFLEANVTDFKLESGTVHEFAFALPPRPAEMSDEVYELQDFTVTAQQANEMMSALELKTSSVNVLSALGAQDFSKFAASDLGDAVKKVSGVSVVGGKYAVIRGLGDRYVSSTLNGLPTASPDPDRQAVQLDLFPSSLFESLEVTKSFTPDQPANSTGGINLNIKPLPDDFFASFSASVGGNSNTTGDDDFLTNGRGNSQDDFANGASGRGLPSGVDGLFEELNRIDVVASDLERSLRGARRPSTFNRIRDGVLAEFPDLVIPDGDIPALTAGVEQVRGLADTAQSVVSDSLAGVSGNRHAFKDAPGPDYSGKLSLGDSFQLSDDLKIGYIGSLNYSRKSRLIEDAEYFRSSVPNSLSPENFENPFLAKGLEDKLLTQATETTSFSWLLGTGLEYRENHKLRLHRMNLKIAENINSRLVGDVQADFPFSEDSPQDYLDTEISESLYYQERELVSDQIIGQHRFELDRFGIEFLDIDWGFGFDEASQNEPGFVQTSAVLLDDPDSSVAGDRELTVSQDAQSGGTAEQQYIIFRDIVEERESNRLDFTFTREEDGPFETKFKVGIFSNESERNVNDEYLFFLGLSEDSEELPTTDDIFNDSAPFYAIDGAPIVGSDLAANVDVSTDASAEYFMLDQSVTDKLRVILGLRQESNSAAVSATGGFERSEDGALIPQVRGAGSNNPFKGLPTEGGYDIDDVYPGLSLIFTPADQWSFRAAYSKTVALPSAREIAPYASSQFIGGDVNIGNAALGVSDIESHDLGLTYFNDVGDSFSITYFRKIVDERIEKINGLGIEPAPGVNPFNKDERGLPLEVPVPFNERFPNLFTESQNLGASLYSWYNNPNEAEIRGFEIEARKQLASLGGAFENVSIGGNFTRIEGEVERFPIEIVSKDELVDRPVSSKRALTDQPEDILNFDITYENPSFDLRVSLIYYQISDVLDATSLSDTYDVYRKSYDQLDLTASKGFKNGLKLSLSVKNLTDSERGSYYDVEGFERDRDTFKRGLSYSFGASYEF